MNAWSIFRGGVKVRLFWAWYDLWIGAYWSRSDRTLYIVLIPTIVLALELR